MSIHVRKGHSQYDVEIVDGDKIVMILTWPDANKLQHDLRQACIEAGITIMGGIYP